MSKEAMKLAVEMLQNKMYAHAEMYLTEALAKQEQGPMAWMCHPFGDDECEFSDHQECENCIPLYTTPPQRAWVELTARDWNVIGFTAEFRAGAEWANIKLKEKNNA